jgi:hypothetical protein
MAISSLYINMKKKFESILREYGETIHLRRRCLVEQSMLPYGQHPNDCTGCHGKGYTRVLEAHTMRYMIVGSRSGYTMASREIDTGIVIDEGEYFFCLPEVMPKEGDIIYAWKKNYERYFIYEIEKALPRTLGDHILFWTCACNLRKADVGA